MEKVAFEGKEYTLKQDAYLDGVNDSPVYEAAAIDEEGKEVMIEWAILEHWINEDGKLSDELQDESEACDWSNPARVYSI